MANITPTSCHVAVIGGGPAGLMAAEVLAGAGIGVTLFERMPSVGRKLLMAGRGGLNITHSEPLPQFVARYGTAAEFIAPLLDAWPPATVQAWCQELGQATFVGSSGRVFPTVMKASPLLRAWISRLESRGVKLVTRAEWTGWDGQFNLHFANGAQHAADAVVLALGGASWPRLGSTGNWPALLPDVAIAPWQPVNCGFIVAWSTHFAARFAGAPLKRVVVGCDRRRIAGELMITATGIEGGAIYGLSAVARDLITRQGQAELRIDLRPDLSAATLNARLSGGSESLSTRLRKLGLPPVAIALVQEARHSGATLPVPELIKSLPLRLLAPAGLERAISAAGGIRLPELTSQLMLKRHPGVFACGEMLDWEAPTGGYLLQACLALGAAAGRGALSWLRQTKA